MSSTASSREETQGILDALESIVRLDGFVPPMVVQGNGEGWARNRLAPALTELGLNPLEFRFHLAPAGEISKNGTFQVKHNACRVTVCHATNGARIECLLEGKS